MKYRQLKKHEFERFREIDRREIINQIYYHREGILVLENEFHDVPEWTPKKKQEFIKSFYELHNRGGLVFGAIDGEKIAGISTLDVVFIGKNKDQLNLAGLWVSKEYRKQGIATSLVELAKKKAVELGANKLYVSATPSLNTIEFYKKRGFILTNDVDKKLFEKEPEDIHMELEL